MYLSYPAPDDEALARCAEPLQTHLRALMRQEPRRFAMKPHRKARRQPPPRKGSDNPLRLAAKAPERARRTAPQPVSSAAEQGRMQPEAILRQALAEARQRGLTLDALAERLGFSERTLRRRLQTPADMPLGEYCRIVSAARAADAEGGS